MAKLESNLSILDFDQFETRTEADASHQLGEAVFLADRRVFRHCEVGASNITRGKLQQDAAPIANHANLAIANPALGDTLITITPGATAGAANLYGEGYLCVNDVDGEGSTHKIKGHPAITASVVFDLTMYDPIRTTDWTANTQVTLVHNGFKNVVEVAVATRRPAGVPVNNISSGDFGWLQTKGVASVLAGTTRTLGAWQISSGATAGAVVDNTDVTAPQTERLVGVADIIAGTDTEYNPMTLQMD